MSQLFDGAAMLAGIRDAIGSTSIRVVSGNRSEIRPPCVQILPPGLDFDISGESWDVAASNWPLMLWYASASGEVDTDGEIAFTMSVLHALRENSGLGGPQNRVSGSYPTIAETPQLITEGDEKSPNRLFRRTVILHVDHT